MPINRIFLVILVLFSICLSQQAKQKHQLLGTCEGCEAIFEHGDKKLTSIDTLPDFNQQGPKLKISGTVFQKDGKTPAANVILYIYHTNQVGIYPITGSERGWARRHGTIRGWIKTGSDGRYSFYTLKPGTYPSRSSPSHIHITVLEPDGRYYWLESFLFAGDPLLKKEHREISTLRGGGNNIMKLENEGDLLLGTRDIILGKNVPGY